MHKKQALELTRKAYIIAGVDEAGRGPLAGPVVAAAVVLNDYLPPGLKDSKLLLPKKREKLYELILANAFDIGVGIVSPKVIDGLNIRKATLLAMRVAVESLSVRPDKIIVDGVDTIPGLDVPQVPVIHGDIIYAAVSAASIVAKVLRDRIMNNISVIFPLYSFEKHKGYPTNLHKNLIRIYGPTPIHRVNFKMDF